MTSTQPRANGDPIAVARPVDATDDNPYTLGVFAPVHDELTLDDLTVIGEIPKDLNGVYLRNGPNRQFEAPGRYHMFDGDGMIHAAHFENGKVRYRNRYVQTKAFQDESEAGRALWTGLMENPQDNPWGNGHGLGIKDSANTDVIYHRGQVLATWYLCGTPYAVDPLSLETLGAQDFLGTFAGDMMAHPKVDEATGELIWFDYGPDQDFLRYGIIGADGRQTHLTQIDLPGPRLPHDIGITENYSILMDLPLVQDHDARRAGKYRIFYDQELPARFAVIPRHGNGSEVRWFEVKPCYIYHVVNSWEEGDEIIMDVCRVKNPQHQTTFASPLSNMLAYMRLDAQLYRYRFNLRTGTTIETELDNANIEFPSVDSRVMGRSHRYSYSMSLGNEPTLLFDGLVRFDSQTGIKEEHKFGSGRWGSEAPFAPRDGSTGETDGYLVCFVNDEAEDKGEINIFDAEDVAAGPIARVLLPRRVPSGFHATWVRADQLIEARA
ncbi:carotenoid cleavage dioxygenase-like enzyme [Rhodococcus sp. PvR044]|uniref:carotenoid oxygenase family protein n=1 Tax=unclassified Rhodococcus (in: high G+C Gram-positive bacteria) TaxID=192944 RepID=UPI000BCBDB3C|nr:MULTISPECIES: carotenoid oxygenase family protein [unclassified Rhodococcus (in: high G+C Gram-positive bacteria)]MBP1161637.1 carotenoid cleavage dioxygenase [Rhodococcus sp. PvR099]PTR38236.1 carotenoid cleavage dioxygenase [Rhodococcus sp. OK611]SNX93168.1 carotenoid cleavage dioxygenase [Rhodococcus sp. OK270]